MKPEPGIWNTLTKIVIFLIVLAGLIVLVGQYLPLIQQNERMRREIHRLQSELETERKTSAELLREIELLTQDPAALEREIRATLGLARPGEMVIRFDSEATNATETPY